MNLDAVDVDTHGHPAFYSAVLVVNVAPVFGLFLASDPTFLCVRRPLLKIFRRFCVEFSTKISQCWHHFEAEVRQHALYVFFRSTLAIKKVSK